MKEPMYLLKRKGSKELKENHRGMICLFSNQRKANNFLAKQHNDDKDDSEIISVICDITPTNKPKLLTYESYGDNKTGGYNVHYASNMKYMGCIHKEIDGLYVYEPEIGSTGYWSGDALKELGVYLVGLNYEDKINTVKKDDLITIDGGDKKTAGELFASYYCDAINSGKQHAEAHNLADDALALAIKQSNT